jgi:divalent metal cation (Fe/Co/Zn/Cd) transporter
MTDAASTAGMQREKKAVALNSIFAAVAITLMKVVVGIGTGSLGILSEAAHSGLDLVAAAITYFSVRVSDKPADAEHQYGHGKIESFSAFLETGLLLLTCVWIVYEAGKRLFIPWKSNPRFGRFWSWAPPWWRTSGVRDGCGASPTSTTVRHCRPTPCTSILISGPAEW